MADRAVSPQDQSLPDLLRQLAQEGSTLVRQEIDLAKAEVGHKVGQARELAPAAAQLARKDLAIAGGELAPKARSAGIGVAALVIAAVVGLLVAGMVAATLTATLAVWLPVWAAALIVTILLVVVAGLLAKTGVGRLKAAMPPVPVQALEALKRDVETLKAQVAAALPPVPKQTVETVKDDVVMVKEDIGVLRAGLAGHPPQPPSTAANGHTALELTGSGATPRPLSEEARHWLEQRGSS